MPSRIETCLIRAPRGYRNTEAALFLAQFDQLSDSLWQDLADIKPAELAWQPRRGMNTVGMLLAHNAIVEVFWMQRSGTGFDAVGLRRTLGIGIDDDGMPIPPEGAPPAALRGWNVADYRALHAKARAYAKRTAKAFTTADLERRVDVKRRDGKRFRFNIRWMLYHLLEHYAGHYGQILLLRHQYKDRRKAR
jgi:uncharacterized damage-inducible protein DinB